MIANRLDDITVFKVRLWPLAAGQVINCWLAAADS